MDDLASIDKRNVGRIAERIVANELEMRGFRVTDLNREGRLAANADLLAAGHDWIVQVQVKEMSMKPKDRWRVQYGYSTLDTIGRREPMFNRASRFYVADFVVLVGVRSASEYRCVVLPIERAEEAAQKNLDRYFRRPKRDGTPRKPSKVWIEFEGSPKSRRHSSLLDQERSIINEHRDKWDLLLIDPSPSGTNKNRRQSQSRRHSVSIDTERE